MLIFVFSISEGKSHVSNACLHIVIFMWLETVQSSLHTFHATDKISGLPHVFNEFNKLMHEKRYYYYSLVNNLITNNDNNISFSLNPLNLNAHISLIFIYNENESNIFISVSLH